MTFTFRKAIREQTSTLIALAGPSGSGKTYSGLRLARGLVGPAGRIAFIDTEARRGLHYADQFEFEHTEFTPPFSPERFTEAVLAAERAGFGAIVVDSMSHEYVGEGGLQDMQEAEVERMVTHDGKVQDWKRDAMTAPAWKKPKLAHKRMVNRLLQVRAHIIFCMRAEEKVKFDKVKQENGREKTVIVPLGFQPICEKAWMYEMTASFLMRPDKPGVGDPIKLQDQHKPFFPPGQHITEDSGGRLAAWARGGAPISAGTGAAPIADGAARATGATAMPAETGAGGEKVLTRAECEAIAGPIVAALKEATTAEQVAQIMADSGPQRERLPDNWDDRLSAIAMKRGEELRAGASGVAKTDEQAALL